MLGVRTLRVIHLLVVSLISIDHGDYTTRTSRRAQIVVYVFGWCGGKVESMSLRHKRRQNRFLMEQ